MAKGSKKARQSAARLAATQAVYQMVANQQKASSVIEEYLIHRSGMEIDGEEMIPPDSTIFRSIVKGVERRKAELLPMVQERLNGREVEPLLFGLMLCGAYEILEHEDIDAPIIIADYMNVTNAFYSSNEPKLVNAVLDGLCNIIRK